MVTAWLLVGSVSVALARQGAEPPAGAPAPETVEAPAPAPAPVAQTTLPGAPPVGAEASWQTLVTELDARPFLSGVGAYEVVPGGSLRPLFERWPHLRLSIGTTGMFFVHSVAVNKTSGGVMRWDTPIALDLYYKAWPHSATLDAPEGTFITLADWSRRMMLASDNTAAEHLIAIFGRDTVEAEVGRIRAAARSLPPGESAGVVEPFLTPGEFWKLKASFLSEPLECYAWSGDAERRLILDRDVPGMKVEELVAGNWMSPQVIDRVGWFASPRELCVLASDMMARSAATAMRPGLEAWRLPGVEKNNPSWRRVWGKLGGEPGVLAGVWAVETRDGRLFLLSMIFNDAQAALPEATTVTLIRHGLDALSGEM